MSEVKKIATREAFGETLVELGKKHPELVVLDADLAAATKTAVFKKSFPDRHFDCGIAEANMMGVWQQDFPSLGKFRWRAPLPCLQQAVLTNRSVTLSAILI